MRSKVAIKRQATLRPRERVVYMDSTDFWHEVGEASGGSKVYASIEEVLKHNSCAKECGVVSATIKYKEQVLPSEQLELQGQTISEWKEYQVSAEYLSHLEDCLIKAQAVMEQYQDRIKQIKEPK